MMSIFTCEKHDPPVEFDAPWCPVCVKLSRRIMGQGDLSTDTIGSAIDALNAGIAMVNAASERMKAFGLTPQISVNGHDYGDKVSVRLDGDLTR